MDRGASRPGYGGTTASAVEGDDEGMDLAGADCRGIDFGCGHAIGRSDLRLESFVSLEGFHRVGIEESAGSAMLSALATKSIEISFKTPPAHVLGFLYGSGFVHPGLSLEQRTGMIDFAVPIMI